MIAAIEEERKVKSQHIEDLVQIQAYADDQMALILGTSAREIEAKWERAWRACSKSNTT